MSEVLKSELKEPEFEVDKVGDGTGDDEKLGTARDKTDMHRLGKLQELRVSEFERPGIVALFWSDCHCSEDFASSLPRDMP